VARSLAFWLENLCSNNIESAQIKKNQVELHFNFWSLKKDKISYLDIGVRVSNVCKFGSINFYLPFDSDRLRYVPQLGKTVCENTNLISAIFNCPDIFIQPNSNQGFYDIDFTSRRNERPIRFYTQLLVATENSPGGVQISPQSDNENKGCNLKFPSNLFTLDPERDLYFRFRINLNDEDEKSISTIYEPTWSSFTNYFEVSEIIDFRVNESRNLPDKVKSNLTDSSYLRKIHFFLIRDTLSEYKMSHSIYNRCRLLESDLWDKYLGVNDQNGSNQVNNNKKQMLIYHWKEIKKDDDNGIDHFSAFAKFSDRTISGRQVLIVVVIIIFFGTLSGLLANNLPNLIEWLCSVVCCSFYKN
jgi:hypothetical protein